MKSLSCLVVSLLLVTTSDAAAQGVSFEIIAPGGGAQAISVSANGDFIVGTGFLWSKAGGLVTNFGAPGTLWGITDDGSIAAGPFFNGSNIEEAAVWDSTNGLSFKGTHGAGNSCGFDLSHLFGLSADGTTAAGMSWQACKTWPIRWTDGVGITLLSKQNTTSSARASALSANGLVAGGWDTGLAGGGSSSRRACLWTDDMTQLFVATTPGNANGLGEVLDINTDGSICSGTTQNQGYRWTAGGGLDLLPNVSGLGGQYYANGISDDGSVAVGVRLQFPTATAVIWPKGGGAMTMQEFLAANGVMGVSASDVRNCTGVSDDGTVICGWGNSGAWIVTIDETWEDLGDGLAGTHGEPVLSGTGDLEPGSLATLQLENALENASVGLVMGLSALNAPFKGGVLVPDADFVFLGLTTSPAGALELSAVWPAGVPSGFVTYFQEWVFDPVGPSGFAASNGLGGTAP